MPDKRQCEAIFHQASGRTLDQQISMLRRRIEIDPARPRIIRTVHGLGYRFDPA